MKGYDEEFRFEDGVLHVRLSGTYPVQRAPGEGNLFQPLIDGCAAHGCRKALIDARTLDVALGTMGLFQAGTDAAHLTRSGLRIALLARPDMLDPFFEDVARNRGGDVGVFTDADAARAWLMERGDASTGPGFDGDD